MHRINAAGFAPGNLFTDGNPATGTPATVVDAGWLNDLQENVVRLIEALGITPIDQNFTQLTEAILTRACQRNASTAAVGAGTANAITAAFTPAVATLTAGMSFWVRATGANTVVAPTFTPASGVIAAKAIVKNSNEALALGDISGAGHWLSLTYDLTLDRWVLNNPSVQTEVIDIQPITASVATNALTLTLNPTILQFRSATLTSGLVSRRDVGAAVSLVVPQGATLGATSGQPVRLVLLALDNAGAVELAVKNLAGAGAFDEVGVISTTAISAAATSPNAAYSAVARTNVPYRIVGFVDSTQVTAGTYLAAPSLIQGAGGHSLQHISPIVTVAAANATGTAVDFTGIPLWVSRITLMFNGVSTVGTSPIQVQVGAGAIAATGYLGSAMVNQTGVAVSNHTTGFRIEPADPAVGAASVRYGKLVLTQTSNGVWVADGLFGHSNQPTVSSSAGAVALAGVLDRIRVTTLIGTETFDAGSISIFYE